jgi:hypothetical protein
VFALGGRGWIVLRTCKLQQYLGIFQSPLGTFEARNQLLEAGFFLEHLLRLGIVVPEVGLARIPLNQGRPRALAVDVKEAP